MNQCTFLVMSWTGSQITTEDTSALQVTEAEENQDKWAKTKAKLKF